MPRLPFVATLLLSALIIDPVAANDPVATNAQSVPYPSYQVRLLPSPGAPPSMPSSLDATWWPEGTVSSSVGAGGSEDAEAIADLARSAGQWAAEVMAEEPGRVLFFEVGAWRGVHTALEDSFLGHSELAAGRRDGERSVEARELGESLGYDAALAAGETDAQSDVEREFRDLSHQPRYSPSPRSSWYEGVVPALEPPRIADVMREVTPHGIDDFHELIPAWVPWSFDPRRLVDCHSLGEIYRDDWRSPEAAFSLWTSEGGEDDFYDGLSSEDQTHFRQLFHSEFQRHLARLNRSLLTPAFAAGFEAGWTYGAVIQSVWRYRSGYHEGYEQGVKTSSQKAFGDHYPLAYDQVYAEGFTDWSENPKLEILGTIVEDANRDAVFEPGEGLGVTLSLANFGGRSTDAWLSLSGQVLAAVTQAQRHQVPARKIASFDNVFQGVIASTTAIKLETELLLSAGDQARSLPLRIARPLELEPAVRIAAVDGAAGTATIDIRVRNNSVLPRGGTIELLANGAPVAGTQRPLDALEGRGARWESLLLVGARPLDLLAGRVEVEAVVTAEGVLQDRAAQAIPALALDLDNRDLLTYMVELARRANPDPGEVGESQALMLERLALDWRDAVDGSGNPYKKDRSTGTTHTELADLVHTFELHRETLDSPQIFSDLEPRVLALARDLPGVHPLLRRSLRKLARQLE